MAQKVFYSYDELIYSFSDARKLFIICGDSSFKTCGEKLIQRFSDKGIKSFRFSDFNPNPTTDIVDTVIRLFHSDNYDAIIAVGGGSAIDIAKCVKLFGGSDVNWKERLQKQIVPEALSIPLIAVPTTAGSGSEATRFAVIYYQGSKQSITGNSIKPDAVFFDKDVLSSLPVYQRKATLLDSLCHCIESYWSVNSTEKSKTYAREGIKLIVWNIDAYMSGDESTYAAMQKAAYLAGQAIDITQTTAGHAMSYKITSKYGIAHGHAVALCVYELWPWMIKNTDKCIDGRGIDYLKLVFLDLARMFNANEVIDGCHEFQQLVDSLEMTHPMGDERDLEELIKTVNHTRLLNNPVKLSANDIDKLYRKIVW